MHKKRGSELDGGYGWVIVFASFLSQFIVGGVLYSFGLFFVEISKEFSAVGKSRISWIASILIAVTGIVGPIASIMVNRFGCRLVSLFGSVIATFGFGISYTTEAVLPLYFTIGITGGLGLGFVYFPSLVIVHQYFSKRRATAIGICICGSGLGTFFFQWILEGLILRDFSWRFGLAVESGVILSTLLLGMLYKPITYSHSHVGTTTRNDDVLTLASNNGEKSNSEFEYNKSHSKSARTSILKNPLFIAYMLCDILGSFGYNVSYIYLPELAEQFENYRQSSLLGIVGIANILSRLISGYLSDKPFLNRLYLYNGSLIVTGIGMILCPNIRTLLELQGYAFIFGLSIGVVHGLKTVILVDLVGIEKFTDAFGLSLFISSTSALLGPPIVGLLYDIHRTYQPGFYWVGSVVTLSGVAMLVLVPIIKKLQYNKSKLSELRKIELGVPVSIAFVES